MAGPARITAFARALREPSTLLVAFAWLGATIVACTYVARYGSAVPIQDDLEMVGPLLGEQPFDLPYLWSAHNGHRIPLPRLVYAALARVSGYRLQVLMHAQIALLACTALVLVLTARRLRGGRTSCTDAFFPLLWIGIGNASILLMPFGLTFTLPSCIAALWCTCALRERGAPSRAAWLAMGACVIASPLCGGPGIAQVAPLALWMLVAAFARMRAPRADAHVSRATRAAHNASACEPSSGVAPDMSIDAPADAPTATATATAIGTRAEALAGAAAALLGCVATALYFVHLESPDAPRELPGLADVLRMLAQFSSTAIGPAVQDAWIAVAYVFAPAWIWAIAALVARARAAQLDRVRATALLAALAAASCVGFLIALARAHAGPVAGLAERYAPLCAPLLSCVYLATVLAARPLFARVVQTIGVGALVLVCAPNVARARSIGARQERAIAALRSDVRDGLGSERLADRHNEFFYAVPRRFAERLRWLAWAGMAPFEPPRDAALATRPIEIGAGDAHAFARRVDRADADDAAWVLVVPPAGVVRFALTPDHTHVSGHFGRLVPPGMNARRPLRLRVELREPGHVAVTLFERVLPAALPQRQSTWLALDVELPPHGAGELVLVTEAPSDTSDALAAQPWWSGIELR